MRPYDHPAQQQTALAAVGEQFPPAERTRVGACAKFARSAGLRGTWARPAAMQFALRLLAQGRL